VTTRTIDGRIFDEPEFEPINALGRWLWTKLEIHNNITAAGTIRLSNKKIAEDTMIDVKQVPALLTQLESIGQYSIKRGSDGTIWLKNWIVRQNYSNNEHFLTRARRDIELIYDDELREEVTEYYSEMLSKLDTKIAERKTYSKNGNQSKSDDPDRFVKGKYGNVVQR